MPEVELPNPEEIEEQRRDGFTRRTALTTAVFAVFLAVVSLGGNNAQKEMMLAQQQASDQWAFYQSKAMREHLYRLEKERVEGELLEQDKNLSAEVREHKQARLKGLGEQEARYEREKKGIEDKARELEHERDAARAKDPYFDYAEVLLQISIVLASMSILTGARPIFYTALVAAVLGAFLGADGFLLFFRIPFL
jgi:hypothetical protein